MHKIIKYGIIVVAAIILIGIFAPIVKNTGTPSKDHLYEISVNGGKFTTTELKVDSTTRTVQFRNLFGQPTTAPLDRVVITQLW